MELLNHVESDDINPTRIKRIYDIWTKRVGSMKESPLVVFFILFLFLHARTHTHTHNDTTNSLPTHVSRIRT